MHSESVMEIFVTNYVTLSTSHSNVIREIKAIMFTVVINESSTYSQQDKARDRHAERPEAKFVLRSILPYMAWRVCKRHSPLILTVYYLILYILFIFHPAISLLSFMPPLLLGPGL